MKLVSSLIVAASSLVALATADMLQLNNPTTGTNWNTGVSQFVGWTGNCNALGAAGMNVTIDLVNGPANAVRYVATLGGLDCTGTQTRSEVTVPNTIAPGMYAIIVRTGDQPSYSNSFQINNPTMTTAPSSTTAPTSAPSPKSDASSLGTNAILAFAGAAAVAYQLL
ncbi:hypothetical protein BGX28_004700 [Mortierella sp. GBA30]|nr:hypothetical protein BGX28_004700 [Mortierella sp. GBA30]